MYVSGSKLIISKEFSEPVPGGPVVASVPKCHESREISKTRMYNFATLKGVEALRILAGNLPHAHIPKAFADHALFRAAREAGREFFFAQLEFTGIPR